MICSFVISGSLDEVHLWHLATVSTDDDTTDGSKSIFEGGATASPRWRQPFDVTRGWWMRVALATARARADYTPSALPSLT